MQTGNYGVSDEGLAMIGVGQNGITEILGNVNRPDLTQQEFGRPFVGFGALVGKRGVALFDTMGVCLLKSDGCRAACPAF